MRNALEKQFRDHLVGNSRPTAFRPSHVQQNADFFSASLAPDNARLVWDRLPIALACGGLLAGVWSDVRQQRCHVVSALLAIAAMASVAWWHFTEQVGVGDLRPYLLLQGLPMLLIPLWQWIYAAPRKERMAFGGALVLYAVAKLAELNDHQIAALMDGGLTGHTLKHLLATLAAAVIVSGLSRRVLNDAGQPKSQPVQRRGMNNSSLVF